MSESRKPRREAEISVVDNLDDVMGVPPAQPRDERSADDDAPTKNPVIKALLGRESYTWTSPYCPEVTLRFCRPPGGTSDRVNRVLGPDQSTNGPLYRKYMALASITEYAGDRVSQPTTTMSFNALEKRVGYVGPNDEDWLDEPVNAYIFAYECAMYPDRLHIAAEIDGAGLSPDDEKRILKNAGLSRPKA